MDETIMTYEDIDWLELWQNDRKQKSWNSKGAADWDKKAPSFAERNRESPYVALFLARMVNCSDKTVLDIGCGPGTLSLPLAKMAQSVTSIDYSKKMLELLREQADRNSLANITTLHCSWEDDWHELGIEQHDICIASRSMNVDDLPAAIDKLNSFSKKYVFITDRIAPSPFDPLAFEAIDRPFRSGPDYIYTLNMLYSKNIHPFVEILELDKEVHFKNRDEALQSYQWMFKDLTSDEIPKLEKYIESIILRENSNELILERKNPPKWAMIWWKKE